MAYLVTGVGYIGSRLVADMLQRGDEVVAVDNMFSTDRGAIESFTRQPGFHFIEGDVRDPDVLDRAFAARPVSAVFSLAAQSSGHPQAAEPRYTEETNLLAPRLLLDAMVRHDVQTIVYASSFKVYGDTLPATVAEETSYGRLFDLSHLSKCYVEKLLEMYAHVRGLRCRAVRLGVTYGISPVTKTDHRFMTAPNKFCLQVISGEPLQVYASGCVPTGYIHVDDAAEAMWMAAQRSSSAPFTAFNAVTEVTTTYAIAQQIVRAASALGFHARLTADGLPSEIPPPMVQSSLLGSDYRPRHLIEESVSGMLSHFQRSQGRHA